MVRGANYGAFISQLSGVEGHYSAVSGFMANAKSIALAFRQVHILYGILIMIATIIPSPFDIPFWIAAELIYNLGMLVLTALWTSSVFSLLGKAGTFHSLIYGLISTLPGFLKFITALYISNIILLVIGLLVLLGGIRVISLSLGGEYFLYGIRSFV